MAAISDRGGPKAHLTHLQSSEDSLARESTPVVSLRETAITDRGHPSWRLEAMKARQEQREVHRLWQAGGGCDRNEFNEGPIAKIVEYIEWNPVTRGLVKGPTDWVWSSARARAGWKDVPLRIDEIDVTASRSER